ncbi:MAG TPA: NB-ARC domain-containing protein, partial [Candidatus Methylomirabilis sp.]|nr:NB-ARC domain-containing protein [Candidatus Methylomirabilis sp.]
MILRFFESQVKPLLDLEIDEFVISLVEKLMNNLNISLLMPIAIRFNEVECAEQFNTEKRIVNIPTSPNVVPGLLENYIKYYKDEPVFRFKTSLVKYYEESNKSYLYTRYREDAKDAIFENVPIIGTIDKIGPHYPSVDEVFGLSKGDLNSVGIDQTLEQKFGRIEETNGVIHNLPNPIDDYIHRNKVETQLIEKLSHRRLFLTTIDGGGGFGKTELAKNVVWSIIKSDDKNKLPISLQFKYVIWVTGKVEYFQDGSIDTKKQSFETVEDLIDSILYVTHNSYQITKNLEDKKAFVNAVLNNCQSSLLLLDNLETVTEKDTVWKYIIELGDTVSSELKVLITSRTRGGSAEQRLNIRAMEPEEARLLAMSEMKRLDVSQVYQSDDNINILINATGSVPLLIRHSINLISRGYNLTEISKNLPKDSNQALNFMCNFQWNELSNDARKLLMGTAYWGGKLSFAQAKLLCNFDEKQFSDSKEQLQDRSFLIDQTLIDSLVTILPPIGQYAKMKLNEFPEVEEEFLENKKLLQMPSRSQFSAVTEFSDEIALNQIFQRAELLVKRGAIMEAYQWYKQATDRFPENSIAWRSRGDFEYRYFEEDPKLGEESFSKAVPLAPNDPVTYNSWAYWEFTIGSRNSRKLNLKRAIEYNQKACKFSEKIEDSRRIKDFIASAYMKLGYIARDESYRAGRTLKRQEYIKEKDGYFKNAIDILKDNLIENPSAPQEIHHNVIDYNILATAYLALGLSSDKRREEFDTYALYYLIQGLKLDKNNYQLIYTLGHHGVASAALRYGVSISEEVDLTRVRKILDIESKIYLK